MCVFVCVCVRINACVYICRVNSLCVLIYVCIYRVNSSFALTSGRTGSLVAEPVCVVCVMCFCA